MAAKKPVHEERLGRIVAAVWENDTKNGTRYAVTFYRLYRNDESWKRTQSFNRSDLLNVAKLADRVDSFIYTLKQQQAEQPAEQQQPVEEEVPY